MVIEVADEGIGIPPGRGRSESSRSSTASDGVRRRARRGSGVGLALVKHIAEAHGGRVTVESRPGQGSRFTLYLPVARDGSEGDRTCRAS